jgi:hypothetical protein
LIEIICTTKTWKSSSRHGGKVGRPAYSRLMTIIHDRMIESMVTFRYLKCIIKIELFLTTKLRAKSKLSSGNAEHALLFPMGVKCGDLSHYR